MTYMRLLLIGMFFTAGIVPLAAYAQGPTIDGPTQTSLTALRTNAANIVGSLSNSKNVTGDQITASYADQLSNMSADQINTVMIVKQRAENAAWTQMDPTSRGLIKNYFAAVHDGQSS